MHSGSSRQGCWWGHPMRVCFRVGGYQLITVSSPRELSRGLFQTTNCMYADSTLLIWSSVKGPASQPVTQGGASISAFEFRGRSGAQTSRTIILPSHAFVDMSTLCSGSPSLSRPSLCLAVRLRPEWLRKEIAANSVLHLLHWRILLLKSLRRVNN